MVVISLEQSEYLVTNEDDVLLVNITMSDVKSQDIIVQVTITDETATGKHTCSHNYIILGIKKVFIKKYIKVI